MTSMAMVADSTGLMEAEDREAEAEEQLESSQGREDGTWSPEVDSVGGDGAQERESNSPPRSHLAYPPLNAEPDTTESNEDIDAVTGDKSSRPVPSRVGDKGSEDADVSVCDP